jgi:hypothetical protein
MYQRSYYLLLLSLIFLLFTCKDDPTSSDEEKPIVSIVYPANNSEFIEGTVIALTAEASDNESVKEVEFYIDGELEFTDNIEPYSYEWDTSGKIGIHSIQAKAIDLEENIGFSDTIFVTVAVLDIILPVSNLNFNDHIYPLFSAKCSNRSGCHTISNPAANLLLTDYNEIITHYMSNAPSEPLIHPDNGDISPLYQILIQDAYLGVPRMPLNGTYLNSNQYDGVKTWISEGAIP